MKKRTKMLTFILIVTLLLAGCSGTAATATSTDTEESENKQTDETTAVPEGDSDVEAEGISIVLSDNGITVDGQEISTDSSESVYAGAKIVYYEEGQDETYGEGSDEDAHSEEEAAQHQVITITQPGTYTVSGSISYGQIAVDLGEDAEEDPEAVVNLILNNAEITCTVAPAIVVYHAYECGDDSEENAVPEVDTSAAGFNLILASDSENTVNGAYVAKIYKDGTTAEDIENGDAKKKYKFDAAIDSLVSFNIDSPDNGRLTVNAENEGISSSLHLTVNGGEITINAADDAVNTNEDNVSVLTINGGILTCDSGLGDEGDGIDSNGYIVVNGGFTITSANGKSQDSGVDSDLGIYINGGTILASGNMYDEVSSDSKQLFMVLNFAETMTESDLLMLTDENDAPIAAFSAVNDYTMTVYSCPELTDGTYHLYKVSSVTGDLNGSIYTNITDYQDAEQMQYTSGSVMGMGGGRGGQRPDGEGFERTDGDMEMPDGEAPEMPDGEVPEDGAFERPEGGELPEGEMPEGGGNREKPEGELAEGEMPEKPDGEAAGGEMPGGGFESDQQSGDETGGTEFVLSADSYQFSGITVK